MPDIFSTQKKPLLIPPGQCFSCKYSDSHKLESSTVSNDGYFQHRSSACVYHHLLPICMYNLLLKAIEKITLISE